MRDNVEGHEKCPYCGFEESKMKKKYYVLPPRTLLNAEYTVGNVIGEGGFAITYIAMEEKLGSKIAIKEFYPYKKAQRDNLDGLDVSCESEEDKDFFERGKKAFLEEAKQLAQFFALPGVVSVKDCFEENNTSYIVMEFVEGVNLNEYLSSKGGKLASEEVFALMKPVLISLEKIHEKGVIHRDISPENIMVDTYGNLKLIDFGSAIGGENETEVLSISTERRGYTPMEQYKKNEKQGSWTDVYALCATLYKMLTGITPDSPFERLEKETLVPLREMGVAISEKLDEPYP